MKTYKRITDFLITCSGADRETLNTVAIEKPKFASIGAAILLTAILASVSGGYALFFSFKSITASVLFGILWALLIFNLDRYIIVSIDKNSPVPRQIAMSIPRIFISFVLAVTISKPLELRIFEGSINGKLYEKDTRELLVYDSLISEKKNRLKSELMKVEQKKETDVILNDYTNQRSLLFKQQEAVFRNIKLAGNDTARIKVLTGRLRVINRQMLSNDSLIARRKKQIYSGIEEIETLNAGVKRRIYREIFITDSLYPLQVNEMKEKQANRDLLIRLKALSDLKSADSTMNTVGNLITLLFILLEMSPVLIKLMAKRGLYEVAILAKQNEFMTAKVVDQIPAVKEEETLTPPTIPVQSPSETRQIPTRGFFPKD